MAITKIHAVKTTISEIEENYRKMTADRETAHSTYVTAEKECNELKKLRGGSSTPLVLWRSTNGRSG